MRVSPKVPSQDIQALYQRLEESFLGRCTRRFLMMSGLDRCIVLASQAFTALIPLLVLVSSIAPVGARGCDLGHDHPEVRPVGEVG